MFIFDIKWKNKDLKGGTAQLKKNSTVPKHITNHKQKVL